MITDEIEQHLHLIRVFCDDMTERNWDDKRLYIKQQADRLTAAISAAPAVGVEVKALEFLTAVEALLDWMNGNELAADHKRQRPEDFARICASMLSLRASLEAQEGKDNG